MNDLPSLTVRSVAFSGDGYSITGNAITLLSGAFVSDVSSGANVVSCDLELAGTVTLHREGWNYDEHGLELAGAVRGAGGIVSVGAGTIVFSGNHANTYSGGTFIRNGRLRLAKAGNVDAVPGDLTIGSSDHNVRVTSVVPEQINDGGAVSVGERAELVLAAKETLGPLRLEGTLTTSLVTHPEVEGEVVLTGDLVVAAAAPWTANAYMLGSYALVGRRTIDLSSPLNTVMIQYITTADEGLILRGRPNGSQSTIRGTYTGPTILEGSWAIVDNRATEVTVRGGGGFGGFARAILVEDGEIRADIFPVASATSIRLSRAATVRLAYAHEPMLTAHGLIDLAGSALAFRPERMPWELGATYTIVENTSDERTIGTFAGLPEGSLIEERFRISYSGGTGNDVTITDLGRYLTSTTAEPRSATHHQPFTMSAEVRGGVPTCCGIPSGSVTFRAAGVDLATAPLDAAGVALATVVLPAGTHRILARYNGSDTAAPSEATTYVNVFVPKPVLQSIEPGTVRMRDVVDFVVRGGPFFEGSRLQMGSDLFEPSEVSSTELKVRMKVGDTYPGTHFLKVKHLDTCCVESNEVPLQVLPYDPKESPLVFEQLAVKAPVTRGGSCAWLAGVASFVASPLAVVRDGDRDGWCSYGLPGGIGGAPRPSLWTVVDIATGRLMSGEPDGNAPASLSFPRGMFLRDGSGQFSHVMFPRHRDWTVLWVRPRVGAWGIPTIGDGESGDLDAVFDGMIVFSTSSMVPLSGSPAPPGVELGDLFLLMHREAKEWHGGVVQSAQLAPSGAGVVGLREAPVASEKGAPAVVRVLRTGGTDGAISVRYATEDRGAVAGVRYRSVSGVLHFGPGEIVKTIEIPMIDDSIYTGNGSFGVRLSNPVGAELDEHAFIEVSTVDDDPMPVLDLLVDTTVVEGDSGPRQVAFDITLTGSTRLPVTLLWGWTSDVFGNGPSSPVTFAPGETRKTVFFEYRADTRPGPNVTYNISMGAAENATIRKGSGRIMVVDDDYGELHIFDTTVDERTGVATLRVLLSGVGKPVTVDYVTVQGSAMEGADYAPTSGTLTFSRYTGEQEISIPIFDDRGGEGVEWFSVHLSNSDGATIGRSTGIVSILADDSRPRRRAVRR